MTFNFSFRLLAAPVAVVLAAVPFAPPANATPGAVPTGAVLPSPAPATTGSASGFKLPPTPRETSTPQVQGPVDIEGPVPVTPRIIPTERPVVRPSPSPTPSRPAPPTTLTPSQTDAAPEMRRFTPASRSTAGQQLPIQDFGQQDGASAAQSDSLDAAPGDGTTEITETPLGSLPSFAPPETSLAAPSDQAELIPGPDWWLWAAIAAVLAIVLGAFTLGGGKRKSHLAVAAPVEPTPAPRTPLAPRPMAGPSAQPEPQPEPQPLPENPAIPPAIPLVQAPQPASPLIVSVTASQLSRSMMNVTFGCTISVENRHGLELQNISIAGDLTTAHGRVAASEQIADSATDLPRVQSVAPLAAGESHQASISFTVPVAQIRPIRQGKAILYVPLLRLRVSADGIEPVTRTFVIGNSQGSSGDTSGGKVQPFRIDEMPQTYRHIAARPLD